MHVVLLAHTDGTIVAVGPFEDDETALAALDASGTDLTFLGTAPCGPDMGSIPAPPALTEGEHA